MESSITSPIIRWIGHKKSNGNSIPSLSFIYLSIVRFVKCNPGETWAKQLNILNHEILSLVDSLPLEFASLDDDSKKIQKKWDLIGVQKRFDDLLASSEPVDRARMPVSCTKESSKWLQVIPSSQLGLLLDNAARIAVALRLGCQICEEHKCICGKTVEKNGRHGLSCKNSKGWIPRHNDFNNIISNAISSAGIPNIQEPPGISRIDGKRPDGMTLIPWSRGKSLLWDVTVRDTCAQSYINISSSKAGAVAEQAERKKHNHSTSVSKKIIYSLRLLSKVWAAVGQKQRNFSQHWGKC